MQPLALETRFKITNKPEKTRDLPERIPDTVLSLGSRSIALSRRLNSNALLAVHRVSRSQVLGDKKIFLGATSNEDTGMTVRLDNDLLSTPGSSGSTSTATTTATTFEILAKNIESLLVSNAHLWDHRDHGQDRHDHQNHRLHQNKPD